MSCFIYFMLLMVVYSLSVSGMEIPTHGVRTLTNNHRLRREFRWPLIEAKISKVFSCIYEDDKDFPEEKMPIYLEKSQNLVGSWQPIEPKFIEEKRVFRFSPGQPITLVCPGVDNFLIGTEQAVNTAYCLAGKLNMYLTRRHPKELFCTLQLWPTVGLQTDSTAICPDKSVKGIGYELNTYITNWSGTQNKIYICSLDDEIIKDFYSEHMLVGKHLVKKDYLISSRKFHYEPFDKLKLVSTDGKDIHECYGDVLWNGLQQKSVQLILAPLTPPEDFILPSDQYIALQSNNLAYQWDTIYNNTWLILENMVREVAKKNGNTFQVFTGTSGNLAAPSDSADCSSHKINVARYIWKIIFSQKSSACIVIVLLNSTDVSLLIDENICIDLCEKSGWKFFIRRSQGRIRCCFYPSVKEKLTLPNIDCKITLAGPSAVVMPGH